MTSNNSDITVRLARLPDRILPRAYFYCAHFSLLVALGVLLVETRSISGFFYHPRMLAVVHLVTLGWISSSILGSLYLIGPMALRTPIRAGRLDRWAFAGYLVGGSAMVSHFWIDAPIGMVIGAMMVTVALIIVGARFLSAVWRGPMRLEVKIFLSLPFANIFGAAGLGILIGLDKTIDLLPGTRLQYVYAHAHLAALGWATMMVMAAGHRLLPMLLPSALPQGRRVWSIALCMEVGVLGLAGSLMVGSALTGLFGGLCLVALALFARNVLWMLRNPRPSPKHRRHPDLSVVQVFSAFACLAGAAILGGILVFTPNAEWKLGGVMAYGVLGLVGFLSQIIAGVTSRLVPLYSWLWAYAASGYKRLPPSPHAMPSRSLHWIAIVGWAAGVPSLAVGFALNQLLTIRFGASVLLVAVACGLLQLRRVLRLGFAAHFSSQSPPRLS